MAYCTYGTLNEERSNAVLVCHALTGDQYVAEEHPITGKPGWWERIVGPGKPLDTDRFFVICSNVLGGCLGTLGPTERNAETGEPYGLSFPVITIGDMVRAQAMLLDHLGIDQLFCVIGGSMGGMQVLEWGFQDGFVDGLVPIGVGGRHSAWCIAWSWTQRHAIESDPHWQGGRYPPGEGPRMGLSLARMIAMITYRSFSSFQERFGRQPGQGDLPFDMISYLNHQGDKLVNRFDANCYLALMHAMDSHDVARGRGEYFDVLATLSQPTLVIGIDSDLLYPLQEQRELAEHLPNAELAILEAGHGHDSFLIERDEVNRIVKAWRDRVF